MLFKLDILVFMQADCICVIFHNLSTSWETLDIPEMNSQKSIFGQQSFTYYQRQRNNLTQDVLMHLTNNQATFMKKH